MRIRGEPSAASIRVDRRAPGDPAERARAASAATAALRGREEAAAQCEPLVTMAGLDDWLKRALPGEWLTYQRGPWMVHDAVTRRIGELARAGIVDPWQPRSEVRPGCRDFKIQMRSRATSAPAQVAALSGVPDEAADKLLTILRRDSNLGHRCRTNQELAKLCGLATTAMLAWRLKKLEQAGAIRIDTIEAGPEAGWRTVTIAATGKSTMPPPSTRALRASTRDIMGQER